MTPTLHEQAKPKHPFTATRKAPLGQRDPSLYFCDDCGERVQHENHQDVPQADLDRNLIAAIEGER